jgi:cytochrome c oxidase subunit 3
VIAFIVSIIMGVIFILVQGYEYYVSPLTIRDGCLGRAFFLLTGFHGIHVFAGLGFLSVACFRLHRCHFRKSKGFFNVKGAVAYWHFVDVVWIGLYGVVYWFSGDRADGLTEKIATGVVSFFNSVGF